MTRVFVLTDGTIEPVKNALFDKWTYVTYNTFSLSNWSLYNSPTFVREEDVVRFGGFSAKVTTQAGTAHGWYQDVNTGIIEGTTVYVILDVYISAAAGGPAVVGVSDYGSGSNFVQATATGVGYHTIIAKKTVGIGTGGIRVWAYGGIGSGSTIYFDMMRIANYYIEFIDGVQDTTFHIENWEQSIFDYKGGGVIQSSPMGDESWFLATSQESVQEQISFRAGQGTDQDTVISKVNELLRALRDGSRFWAEKWRRDPLYITAKANNETFERYALVTKGRLPQLPDQFSIEFLQTVFQGVSMELLRHSWSSAPPGVGVGIPVGWSKTYSVVHFGDVDTLAADDFNYGLGSVIANGRSLYGLTFAYIDDGGVFGSELLSSTPPTSLLPAVPATNDAVYFGINTTGTYPSVPFASISMFISQAAVYTGAAALVWEIYTGSWTTAGFTVDGPNQLDQIGPITLSWFPVTAWTSVAVNGVTGYWVRARVSLGGGTISTIPKYDVRIPHTVNEPSVKVLRSELTKGSHHSKLRLYLEGASDDDTSGQQGYYTGIYAAIRDQKRGNLFHHILNASDKPQNDSNITVTAGTGTAAVSSNVPLTGRAIQVSAGTPATNIMRVTFAFNSFIAQHFIGEYRAFLRVRPNSSSAGFQVQLRLYDPDLTWSSPIKTVPSPASVTYAIDMGKITLPSYGLAAPFEIEVWTNRHASITLNIYDLILMPTDEWFGFFYYGPGAVTFNNSPDLRRGTRLEIDPLSVRGLESRIYDITNDNYYGSFLKQSGSPFLRQGTDQRVYFFGIVETGQTSPQSDHRSLVRVRAQIAPQYASMRGAA